MLVSEAAVAVHGVDLVWSEQRVDTTFNVLFGSADLRSYNMMYILCAALDSTNILRKLVMDTSINT